MKDGNLKQICAAIERGFVRFYREHPELEGYGYCAEVKGEVKTTLVELGIKLHN